MNLAEKYRPKTFEDVCGQSITTTIIKKAIEQDKLSNCLLLSGSSGCGKTTLAKIIAREVNKNIAGYQAIELDCASHNGVDDVRAIIDDANKRDLIGKYKVFILDEAHSITTQGWQAFLKTIEDAPEYTMFIFCTTEPNKLPATILNRLQRYNITPIDAEIISNNLQNICTKENYSNFVESCNYISRVCNGCMREAITMLEQCALYSTDLSLDNVKKVIGTGSFETMIILTNKLIDKDEKAIITLFDDLYNNGQDLKAFLNSYLGFNLDLLKYLMFKDIKLTGIPAYLETIMDNSLNVRSLMNKFSGLQEALTWFKALANQILAIKQDIKGDTTYKYTIQIMLLQFCRDYK